MIGRRRTKARLDALAARVARLETERPTLRRYWNEQPRTWGEVTGYGEPRRTLYGSAEPKPYAFGGVHWGDHPGEIETYLDRRKDDHR